MSRIVNHIGFVVSSPSNPSYTDVITPSQRDILLYSASLQVAQLDAGAYTDAYIAIMDQAHTHVYQYLRFKDYLSGTDALPFGVYWEAPSIELPCLVPANQAVVAFIRSSGSMGSNYFQAVYL